MVPRSNNPRYFVQFDAQCVAQRSAQFRAQDSVQCEQRNSDAFAWSRSAADVERGAREEDVDPRGWVV